MYGPPFRCLVRFGNRKRTKNEAPLAPIDHSVQQGVALDRAGGACPGALVGRSVTGPQAFPGGNDYDQLRVALYAANKTSVARSPIHPIGRAGSIVLG